MKRSYVDNALTSPELSAAGSATLQVLLNAESTVVTCAGADRGVNSKSKAAAKSQIQKPFRARVRTGIDERNEIGT